MKQELLILSTLVSSFWLTTGHTLAATMTTNSIMYDATSSGSAMAGTVMKNGMPVMKDGMPVMTTPKQVMMADAYAKRYNGFTKQIADYVIVLDDNNMVDTTKSTVTFTTVKYTSSGELVDENFPTLPIPITGVTLMNNDPTMIASFTFNSPQNWYSPNTRGARGTTGNGLSGSINLKTDRLTVMSSYIFDHNGAILKYDVTGNKTSNTPSRGRKKKRRDNRFLPVYIPEPNSTLSLLTFGAMGAGATLLRNKKQKSTEEVTDSNKF